jgi:hypothetical protein
MTTLLKLFDTRRNQLNDDIAADPSPENVARASHRLLKDILATYRNGEYLDPVKRILAAYSIDILISSLSTLTAANTEIFDSEQPAPKRVIKPSSSKSVFLLRLVQAIIALALVTLFGLNKNLIYLWLFAGLLIVTAAAPIIKWLRNRLSLSDSEPADGNLITPAVQAKVRVHMAAYLAQLADALLTVDKLVAEAPNLGTNTDQDPGPVGDPALLDLFQDLLEARRAQDSEFALKQVGMITFILQKYGIIVEEYNHQNGRFFDFIPSLNPDDTTRQTLRPALVKDNRPLRRGLVTEPTRPDGTLSNPLIS